MMEQENAEDGVRDESDSSESGEDDSDFEADKKSGEGSKFFEEGEESINNHSTDPRETNRSLNNTKDPNEIHRSLNNSKDPCGTNRSLNNSKDPCENNRSMNNPEDGKCTLEKAFDKLRKRDVLDKKEEKTLIDFADRFVTCTLNPDMAAKMISRDTDTSKGRKIVKIAKETQTHHHTKTCKKTSPDCRFGMPRYPMWKTVLSKPVKGADEDEKRDRRIRHTEVLKAVLGVLEDEKVMTEI